MPPQPGVFAVSHTSTHKVRAGAAAELTSTNTLHYEALAGPSSRPHAGIQSEEAKKDKRRKEVIGKITKEMAERRDEIGRHYTQTISDLHSVSIQLSTRPETHPAYNLRLYPISLERGALLSSIAFQERHALQAVQTAYDEERERVEEEWRRGRERIRERMLEGIEERRRRAREEKEGEGTVVDGGMDSQSRPHITRKLRNKMNGTSPPPTPVPGGHPGLGNGAIASISSGPVTSGPLLNPHSLSVDELPSPFPLPLISAHSGGGQSYGYGAGSGPGNGRRRAKGGGREAQAPGTLGKSLNVFNPLKDVEYEADLGEIRRGNKRRRAAAGTLAGKA
ncbi:hypothetical protein C8Q70DRAFT_1038054 [Cubamyces menziesii]|uniref:Centrosomal protein ATPase n=1 Tax=Trametes cubensis TaxID=1111947 RepID=A0AAD7U3I7_9APHY|nr:hypothetical protein C8Q70DRAFT_1038054 [Cubamyces menziesii]KAJ8495312.1 hypothetical protein ONZ51_g1738 [Trametes cubensis]